MQRRTITISLFAATAAAFPMFAEADMFGQIHDFRDKSPSEENTLIPSARTADDFVTRDSKYAIDFVSFSMIVNWPDPPTLFAVDFFQDDGGKPGEFLGTFDRLWNVDDRGAWNGNDDLHLLDVTIRLGGFPPSDIARFWLSCYAIGDGSGRAWWGTAGDGVVNGLEGQFMSDHFGVPDWTPISQSGILDFPTDFAFTLDPPVPAPGVLALIGLGLAGTRRRRAA